MDFGIGHLLEQTYRAQYPSNKEYAGPYYYDLRHNSLIKGVLGSLGP